VVVVVAAILFYRFTCKFLDVCIPVIIVIVVVVVVVP